MNCSECRNRLPELIYGELDEPLAGDIRAHLDACPECHAEHAALDRTIGVLDAWSPVEPAGDAAEVAAAAVAAGTRPSVLRRIGPWAAGLAAGFALALVVAMFIVNAQRERVLAEIDRERQFTLEAIDVALQEWAAEQDLQRDALVRVFEDARAQDLEQIAGALEDVAAHAARDTRETRQAIDSVMQQMVSLDRTEIVP